MKILIGYDGSEYGKIILDDLSHAGLPENTEAVLMTVADVREIPTSPFLAEQISAQIEHLFKSDEDRIRFKLGKHLELSQTDTEQTAVDYKDKFPGWKISYEAVYGNPAKELIKKADEIQPDILVVGSHGRSALGRTLLGSVSQKVLHEARCSVRISRKTKKIEEGKTRLLIAVDGSKNVEAAVESVAKRIWTKETEVCLVAVNDPFNRSDAGYLNWDIAEDKPIENERFSNWVEAVLNKPKQILESKGLQVSHRIICGDAANMILQEITEWNADTIFLGARGLGRVKRFLLGSVSSRVAANAECTVEVFRI